ncbi:putative mitochondrial protein AtMg00860 [Nicotiana tabacum]|uniref:Mitochondrial protein AtMg00860 n=1 Tax=Nicotiana tabacum TaxID=4097 RepID=A0AC58SIB8_TOBAC
MPFGITNAHATFQALMNQVFLPFLIKFVLVFFDDILVYSQSLADHIDHLAIIFETLKKNTLYAKRSKCSFGQPQVEYLGHVINAHGVTIDRSKVQAMVNLPNPTSIKKKGFRWSEEADQAFAALKRAMPTTSMLTLPDYTQPFCG